MKSRRLVGEASLIDNVIVIEEVEVQVEEIQRLLKNLEMHIVVVYFPVFLAVYHCIPFSLLH